MNVYIFFFLMQINSSNLHNCPSSGRSSRVGTTLAITATGRNACETTVSQQLKLISTSNCSPTSTPFP